MADVSNIVVKITAKADGFKKGIRESLSLSKRFTRETKTGLYDVTDGLTDASRAAGITRDKMGKLREATGKFVSTERMAELGIENWNKAADKGGKRAKSLGFRIGKLKVDFGALSRAAAKSRAGLSKIGGVLPSLRASLTATALSAAGFVTAIAFKADTIKQIQNVSTALGMNAQDLQKWIFAAGKFNIAGDKVKDIFKDMSDKIGDFLATGGGEANELFENLAIDAREFIGLAPDKALLKLGEATKGLTREKQIFFFEAIANDVSKLLPLLDDNASAFKRLAIEAEKTGNVLSDNQIALAAKFSRTVADIIAKAKGFASQLTVFLSGPFDILAKKLDETIEKFGGPTEAAKQFALALINGVASALKGLSFLIDGFKDFQLELNKVLLSFDKFNKFNPFARGVFAATGFDIDQQIESRQSKIKELEASAGDRSDFRKSIDNLSEELRRSVMETTTLDTEKTTEDNTKALKDNTAKVRALADFNKKMDAKRAKELQKEFGSGGAGGSGRSNVINAEKIFGQHQLKSDARFEARAAKLVRDIRGGASQERIAAGLESLGAFAERLRDLPLTLGSKGFDVAGAFSIVDKIAQEASSMVETNTRQAKTFEDFQTLFKAIEEKNKPKKVGTINLNVVSGTKELSVDLQGDPEALRQLNNIIDKRVKNTARAVAQ